MDCKMIKKYLSDKVDLRLSQKIESRISAHTSQCRACEHDVELYAATRSLLKSVYPDVIAPSGFSSRVMATIGKGAAKPVYPIWSLRSNKILVPAAAIAACAVLITGLYFQGAFLPAFPGSSDERQAQILQEEILREDESVTDEQSYVNGEMPLPQAEKEVVKVESPSGEIITAQNEQNELQPTDILVQEIPELKHPVADQSVPSPESKNRVSVTRTSREQAKPTISIVPISSESQTSAFVWPEIPHPSVFIPRERKINTVSITMDVGRIDRVLTEVEDRERLFRVMPEMTVTDLRGDGTIVMMKSYIIPLTHANLFIDSMKALGDTAEVQKSTVDMTLEYDNMLRTHRKLISDVSDGGEDASDINELISQMIVINERSKENVVHVVVWMRDSIDF